MSRWLIRLYPRRWRDRDAEEFQDLLEQEGLRPRIVGNVVLHALATRLDVRRPGVRAFVGAVAMIAAEWYAYGAGYPNALWLPRRTAGAALLMLVLGALATTIEGTTRLIAAMVAHRRASS